MGACVLAATLALLAAPPPETSARIAVIVQGDGLEAGRIQGDVERELILQQANVKSAAELAQKLGLPAETPAPPNAVLLDNAKTKIAEAEAAFLRGEFDIAKASAGEAKKLLATLPAESVFDERVLASLWYAASIQPTDVKAAQREIRELLHDVDPKPNVSVDVFPPDFVGFVETERLTVKTASVRLTDLPAAAQIWVNGRKVDSNPFSVVLHPANKPNVVTVRAQGYRTAVLTLPLTPPPSTRVPLALALTSEQEAAVRAAFAGKSDQSIHRTFAALADVQPPVTALLLLQTRGKAAPSALLWRNKTLQPIVAPSLPRLATNVIDTFRAKRSGELSVVTAGAMDVSLWQRDLGGGDVYSLALTGTGPRISADLHWNLLLASAELSYVRYLTPIEASVTGGGDDGKSLQTGGGSALRLSAGVGVNRAFGSFSAGALVGGRFEQYSTEVLKVQETEGGAESQPIIGPHTWGGPQAQIRLGYRTGSIGIVGGVGAVFASTYTEGEKGMSGTDPVVGTVPFWRLGGTYDASEKLAVGVLYTGESRSTKFDGEPALEQQDQPSDLVLTDFLTTVAVTAAYSF